MIVTPYGIAAVTILMALAPTTQIKLTVAGVVLFILFLDWLAMLAAHVIVRWLGPLLLACVSSRSKRPALFGVSRSRAGRAHLRLRLHSKKASYSFTSSALENLSRDV
jgi:hypothetical protein